MIGVFNSITINNHEIYRGNDFTLQREYIYAGEVETCTGKRCADLVGWRFADLTIEWDALPYSQLINVLRLTGTEVDMTFKNESDVSITEKVIPRLISTTATRFTGEYGVTVWKGVRLQLSFINAHAV